MRIIRGLESFLKGDWSKLTGWITRGHYLLENLLFYAKKNNEQQRKLKTTLELFRKDNWVAGISDVVSAS